MKNELKFKCIAFILVAVLTGCTGSQVKPQHAISLEYLDVSAEGIDVIIARYGQPIKISTAGSAYSKYHYSRFHVTAYKRSGRLNSIIIFSKSYVDTNGISIGDSERKLLDTIPKGNLKTDSPSLYYGDMKENIVYWLKNGRVSKIVLAAQLR